MRQFGSASCAAIIKAMKTKFICHLVAAVSILFLSPSCSEKSAPSGGGGAGEMPSGPQAAVSKGETYRAIDDEEVVKIISSSEVEISHKGDHFVGQYSRDGSRLRATVEVLGTKQAVYYDIVPDGLRAEKGGILYRPGRYEVAMREVQEKRQQEALKRKQQALNEELLEAISLGNMSNAVAALQGGAQVAITNGIRETPIHMATELGMTNLVELLLAKGADPNARLVNPPREERSMRTPLHLVAWLKPEHDATVSLLLKAGADVNAQDKAGQTPLLLAFQGENDGAARLLVAAGADRASALAFAKERIRGGWPDRRAVLRTPDEAKLFEQSRNPSKVIQSIRGFDFEWNKPMDYQFVLSDVGVKVILDQDRREETYFFSDFGLRSGKDPESKDLEPQGRYPKIYRVEFGLGGVWYVNLRTAAERDQFLKSLNDTREAWKKKYGSVP